MMSDWLERRRNARTVMESVSAWEIEDPSTGAVTLRAAAEAANAIARRNSIFVVDERVWIELDDRGDERMVCGRGRDQVRKERERSFSIVDTPVLLPMLAAVKKIEGDDVKYERGGGCGTVASVKIEPHGPQQTRTDSTSPRPEFANLRFSMLSSTWPQA